MHLHLCFTLLLTLASNVNAIDYPSDHWPSVNQALNEINWPMRRHVIDSINQIVSSPHHFSISTSCNSSLQHFAEGLENNREDAFRLLDSWSRVHPGFLSGQYNDFGHWEQCLQTTLQQSDSPTGQYCMYHLSWPLHDSIREDLDAVDRHNASWIKVIIGDSDAFRFTKVAGATCLPSTCSRDEIQSVLDKFTSNLQIPLKVDLEKTCDTLDDFNSSYLSTPIYKQISGYTLICLVITVIWCTLKARKDNVESTSLFVKAFDARNNTAKLNYALRDENEKELAYIHGLRTIYLSVCVYAHFVFVSGMANTETHVGIFNFQGPSNPILSGLTQMSGLLVSWNVVIGAALAFIGWNETFIKSRGKISFIQYLLGRLLRLWPVMAGTLMLILAYPPSWGSGPVFRKSYEKMTQNCLESWWMELLFIGNQRKAMESCIVHGWYIASDLQLYAWAFILIKAFHKSRKLGLIFTSIGIIFGMASQAFQTWYYETGMTFAFTVQRIHVSIEETHLLHFATLNYISSYCIGILLGYVIANKIKVSKRMYICGWLIAIFLTAGTTVWHDFLFRELEVTRFQIILTASLLRTIMAIIGAWCIYSTWLGVPGVTSFFSKHIFVVLGRFNFSTFMVHMLLIWHNDFKLHHPIEYRTFPLISRWITELVCSHALGYLMYLVIEAPFNGLTKPYIKMILSKFAHRSSEKKCPQTNGNGHEVLEKLKEN